MPELAFWDWRPRKAPLVLLSPSWPLSPAGILSPGPGPIWPPGTGGSAGSPGLRAHLSCCSIVAGVLTGAGLEIASSSLFPALVAPPALCFLLFLTIVK